MLADQAQDAPDSFDATQENRAVGWLPLFRDGTALISIMMAAGVAIHALSMRVVATALPSVVTEIGGLRFFAWTTTVAVVSGIWGAVFAPSLGKLRGLRDAYRISLVLFAIGSITCAVAPHMAVFLAGRLLQGLGGGLLTALAYTTIRRAFPENLRTRAIVLLSGIWGMAAFVGPLIGGVFAGWGFWRGAFWIDVPFAISVGVLAEIVLSKSAEAESGSVAVQPLTVCTRLALLTGSALAVSVGGASGEALSSGIGLVLGTILLIGLMRVEQAPREATSFRLLPSGAYRVGNVLGAVSLTMALMTGSTTAAVLYVPYVATEVGGYPPVVGGYLSALLAVSWTFAALLTASAEGVWAERSIILGPVSICLALTISAYGLIHGSFFLMAFGIGLAGAGVGIAWAHLSNLMMAYAKETESDISSAFIYTNQMIAAAFFSALAGMVANLAGFASSMHSATAVVRSISGLFISLALIAATAIPVAVISVRLSAIRGSNQHRG
jgi:MFS family permease